MDLPFPSALVDAGWPVSGGEEKRAPAGARVYWPEGSSSDKVADDSVSQQSPPTAAFAGAGRNLFWGWKRRTLPVVDLADRSGPDFIPVQIGNLKDNVGTGKQLVRD